MNDQKILIPPKFFEKTERLSKDVKAKLFRILHLLSTDFRHPSLQCKKVEGNNKSVFECRVDRDIRLIYDCIPGAIRCWYVGEHDIALKFAENLTPGGISVDDIEIEQIDDHVAILERYLLDGIVPSFSIWDTGRD